MPSSLRTALAAAAVLSAVGVSAHADAVDLSTLQLNGAATVPAPGVLRLTYGSNLADPMDMGSNQGYASSAFIASAFSSGIKFTSSFTFTMTGTGFDPQADGLTFMIQNAPDGATAVGGSGGGIGADGLTNNVGIGFQSWDNDHATIFTNGNVFGGTAQLFQDNPDDPDNPIKTPNFALGHNPLNVVNVNVAYDGTTLSYTADNITTGQSISDSLAFDLTSLGPQVFIGFTGATGLSYSIEDITDWKLDIASTPVSAAPEPASWGLMIAGFGGMGAMLRRRRAIAA